MVDKWALFDPQIDLSCTGWNWWKSPQKRTISRHAASGHRPWSPRPQSAGISPASSFHLSMITYPDWEVFRVHTPLTFRLGSGKHAESRLISLDDQHLESLGLFLSTTSPDDSPRLGKKMTHTCVPPSWNHPLITQQPRLICT